VAAEDICFTTVEDAKRFVEETQVDMLAVSVGTVHGLYR
jgi:fructose-bisphosphate aldolase class II